MEDWRLKNITPELGQIYAVRKDGNYVIASNPDNNRFDIYKNIGNSSMKKYSRYISLYDLKESIFSSAYIEGDFAYIVSQQFGSQIFKYSIERKTFVSNFTYHSNSVSDFIAIKVKNNRIFILYKETGNPKAIFKEYIPNSNDQNTYTLNSYVFQEDIKDFDVQYVNNEYTIATIHENLFNRIISIYKSISNTQYSLLYNDFGNKTISNKLFYNSVTISEKADEIITGCILASSTSRDLYISSYKFSLDRSRITSFLPSILNNVYGNIIGTTDKIIQVQFLLDSTTLYLNDNNTVSYIYSKNTNTNIWEIKGNSFPRTRIFPFIAISEMNFFKTSGGYYEYRTTEYPFRNVNWGKDTIINSTTLRGKSDSDCFGKNVETSSNGIYVAVASNGKTGDLNIYNLDSSNRSLYNFINRYTGVLDSSFGFLDNGRFFFMDSSFNLKITDPNNYYTWSSTFIYTTTTARKVVSYENIIYVYWEDSTGRFLTIIRPNLTTVTLTLNHVIPGSYNFSSFNVNSKSILISYISTNTSFPNRLYSYSYIGESISLNNTLASPYDLVESLTLASNEDILYLVNRKELNVYTFNISTLNWDRKAFVTLYPDNQAFIKLSLSTINDGSIIAVGNGERVRFYRFNDPALTVYGNEIIGDYPEDNFGNKVYFIKNTEDLIISSPANSSNYYSSGRINFYTSSPLISLLPRDTVPGVYDSGEYYLYTGNLFGNNIKRVYKRSSKDTWQLFAVFETPDSGGNGMYIGNGNPDQYNLTSEYANYPYFMNVDNKNIYKSGILLSDDNIIDVIWGDLPVDKYIFRTFFPGDYYVDRKRGELYGPYTDFSWKNSKIFSLPESFKRVNNFFVMHNFVLSQNIQLFNIPNVVIDPVNNIMYGPTSTDINILPRRVIIKDYIKPTQSIGFVGEYLYSSSLRKLYGPKTINSWPDNNIILPFIIDLESNVEMYVGSVDTIPISTLVTSDNILIDLSRNTIYQGGNNSNIKIFRKVLVGAGIPASNIGIMGDFFINQSTLDIYGPKTLGWGIPNVGYWPDPKLLNLPIYVTDSLTETAFINLANYCVMNTSTNMIYIRQLDKDNKIQLSSISFTRYPTFIADNYSDQVIFDTYANPNLIYFPPSQTLIKFVDKSKRKIKNITLPSLGGANILCYLNTTKQNIFQGPKNGEGHNGDFFVEYIPFSDQYILIGPKINDKWLFNASLATGQTTFTIASVSNYNPSTYYLDTVNYNIIYPVYNRSIEVSPIKFPKSYSPPVFITNSTPSINNTSTTNLTYFTGDGKFYIRSPTITAITPIEKAIFVDTISDLPEFRYAYTVFNNKVYSKGNQDFIAEIHKSYDLTGDVIISTSNNLIFLRSNIVKKDIVYCTDDGKFYHFVNPNATNLTEIPPVIKVYFDPVYPPAFISETQSPVYILQNFSGNNWSLLQKIGNTVVKLSRNFINYTFNPTTSNVYVVKNNRIDLQDFDPNDIVLFYDVKSFAESPTGSGYTISFLQIPNSVLKVTPYSNSPTSATLTNFNKLIFSNADLENIKNIKVKHIDGNYFVISVMYDDDRFNYVQVFFFNESLNYLCRVGNPIKAVTTLPVGNKPKDKVKDFLKRTPKERAASEKSVRKVSNSVFGFFTEVAEAVTPDFIEDKISNILKSVGISRDTLKNYIANNIVNGVKLVEDGFQALANLIFDLDEGGEGSFGEDTFYLEKYQMVYVGAPTSYLDKRGTVRLVQVVGNTIAWLEGNRDIGRFGTSIAVGGIHGEVLAVGQSGVFTSDVVGLVKVFEKNSDNIFNYRKQNKGFAVMNIVKNTLRAAATGALIGASVAGVILPIVGVLVAPLGVIGLILFVLIGAAIAAVVSLIGELWDGTFDEWATVEGEGQLFHTGNNIVMSNDGQTLVVPEVRRPAVMADAIKEKSGREKAYDFISKFGETISVTQQANNLFGPKDGAVIEAGIKDGKTVATGGSKSVTAVNAATYLKRAQIYKKLLTSSTKEIGKVALSTGQKATLLSSSVKTTKYLKIKNIMAKVSKCAVGVDFAVAALFLGDSITSAVSFGKLVDRLDRDLDADKFSSVNLYSRSDEWRPSKKLIDSTLKDMINIYISSDPSKLKNPDDRTVLNDAKNNPTKYNKYAPALFTGKSMFGYGSSVGISGDGNTLVAIDKNYINDSPKNLLQRASSLFSEDEASTTTSVFTDYKIIIYRRKFDNINNFNYWQENANQIEEKLATECPLNDYTQVLKLSFDGKYLAVGSPFYSTGDQVLKGRIVVYQINNTIPIKLFAIDGISEYQLVGQGISFETASSGTSLIVSDFDEDSDTNSFSVKYNKFILSS